MGRSREIRTGTPKKPVVQGNTPRRLSPPTIFVGQDCSQLPILNYSACICGFQRLSKIVLVPLFTQQSAGYHSLPLQLQRPVGLESKESQLSKQPGSQHILLARTPRLVAQFACQGIMDVEVIHMHSLGQCRCKIKVCQHISSGTYVLETMH